MIKSSIAIIIAIALTGSLFSSTTVVIPSVQFAFGADSNETEKQSSSDDNNKQSSSSDASNKQSSGGSVSESEAEEIEKQISSSSDEDKKKQLDDDEKKIQDDEKQAESDEKQVQADVVKLESDEKQIKIDLAPQETVVQGKGPQNLQNPSIQQSLNASKQQQKQPNPGTLATPPNVLAQYEADKAKLQADQNKLTSDLSKLRTDEDNYAAHINALSFDMCVRGQGVCISGLPDNRSCRAGLIYDFPSNKCRLP